jgi:hypothetical protein
VQPSSYPTLLAQEEGELVGGYPAVVFPHYILVDAHGTVAAHGHLTEMAMKLDEMSREDMTGTSADDKSRESAKP